jgi:foldase protein PrsA
VKRAIGGALVLAVAGAGALIAGQGAVLAGGAPAATPVSADVVAMVNGEPITMAQLQKPLVEAYGLKILLQEILLSAARQAAREKNIAITDADYAAEFQRTMKQGFGDAPKEDYPALLEQLLEKKGSSRPEFDMVVQTNTILRKIAEPELKDKITDDMLKEAFNQIYGENVIVRHIQCANVQEAAQVKMRLAAGEKFDTLVQTMSRNARTRPLNGELPPFSRNTVAWGGNWGKVPQGFKDWAFSAKVGDISDPIAATDGYHVLKLEKKTEPKVVKFDDVKANLRVQLQEQLVQKGVDELRGKLALIVRQSMDIKEPTLKAQFEKKVAEQLKAAEAEKAREDLLKKGRTAEEGAAPVGKLPGAIPQASPPTNTPNGAPAGGQAAPANASAGERPPATKSDAPAAAPSDAPKSK